MPDTLLLCTDIFGHTEVVNQLIDDLQLDGENVVVVSPYLNPSESYKDESEAYQAFQQAGGIPSYQARIESLLNCHSNYHVLSFSAGGASAWRALQQKPEGACLQHVVFYPGQLRHVQDLTTTTYTKVVFPQREAHFDVSALSKRCERQSRVEVMNTPYHHGFMNPLSSGFDSGAYSVFVQNLKRWLGTG